MAINTENHHFQDFTIWRPNWFVTTRFFAVIGVILAMSVSRTFFGIKAIDYNAISFMVFILLVSNVFYFFYYKLGLLEKGPNPEKRISAFTKIQINADLVILTFMLHYSGGATNPFFLYYFFHTILSSILLSKKAAYIEAGVASLLFSGLTILEGFKIIDHYRLFRQGFHENPVFIYGMITATTSALFIAVYMASSIMDRLRDHQRKLELSLEQRKKLEEEKSHFLDVVAHDLKSPLAAIETMVTSTLAVHYDKIDPDVRKILERIPIRTQELIKFTMDLLEFSRLRNLDQIKIDFKPLNFLPIVTTTVEMYMNQAMDKNIDINVAANPNIPLINGSSDHLERMVANLVSNAIRYTPEKGSVNIKVSLNEGFIVLTVADTGIGIPDSALPNIFKEFYRADNAKKFTSAGTGLGMSITKAIVEEHGGTIAVQSQEGEGTVFTVKLPLPNTGEHKEN